MSQELLSFEEWKQAYLKAYRIDPAVLAELILDHGIHVVDEALEKHFRYQYAAYMTRILFDPHGVLF